MIYLKRVAQEIKTIGLYDLVFQDAQKILQKKEIEVFEIEALLSSHPEILEAYKQTNVEYNISNIHLRDIPFENLAFTCKEKANRVNANLAKLREIEKYTLDFEQSSVLVIIMSILFFSPSNTLLFYLTLKFGNGRFTAYLHFLFYGRGCMLKKSVKSLKPML